MSMTGARAEKAGEALARRRLAEYSRYAEILAEQERALDEGALERFERLAAEALALQRELGGIGVVPAGVHGASPAEVESSSGGVAVESPAAPHEPSRGYRTEVREVLATALERSLRIRDRIATLRNATAGRIRNLAVTRPHARMYIEGPGPGDERRSAHVNVKF